MKRIIALIAAVLMIAGCSAPQRPNGSDEKLTIISTIFPYYDFAREIAGDKADVIQLLSPGEESHTFEPTPKDIIAIQNCDLFIYTGGEGDKWIDNILGSMGEKTPKTLRMMDHVELLEAETVAGMQQDEHQSHGEHHHDYDEHIWTSPQNAIKLTATIAEEIKALDAENSGFYSEQLERYSDSLNELDIKLGQTVSNAKQNIIIVGDRFPFLYLARHYGLEYYAAFPACGSEGDASAATIAFLSEMAKEHAVPAILYIEFSNHKAADAIAETAKVETALLHSCHNVSQQQKDNGESYITLMKQNIDILEKVLN